MNLLFKSKDQTNFFKYFIFGIIFNIWNTLFANEMWEYYADVLKDADEMEEKEMPVRKMLVDMIGAFVRAISASFRARKIAPFFIRV